MRIASSPPAETEPKRGRFTLPIIVFVVLAGVVASALFEERRQSSIEQLTDATVVAQLGSYQKPYPETLRTAARAARENPNDLALAIKAARAYIAYGQSVGDARLVGTALGILGPWLKAKKPNAEVLVLAATALQYNHDFAGALKYLDQALALVPNYDEALLIHAFIDIVQGRLAVVGPQCEKLAATGRIDLVLTCDAAAHALTPDATRSFTRLESFIGLANATTPEVRAYATALLGEIALSKGWRDKARTYLVQANTAQPADLKTMTVYADFLLAEHDPQTALAVLADAPPTDGILVRRAIAYRDLGDTDAIEPIRDALLKTFELQRQLGLVVHAREEARFLLQVQNDPDGALERALANWENQREFEDAQLLLDAADAAGKPSSAQPVLDWMGLEHVEAEALRIPAALKVAAP